MPELPEISLYLKALQPRIVGHVLQRVRIRSPSLLKSWEPPLAETHGRKIAELRRLGKRIVFGLEGGLFLVLHLMVTGRLRWKEEPGVKLAGKVSQAAFEFAHGTLLVTEAGPKKRASLWLVDGEDALAAHDPGGLELLDATLHDFRSALRRENRTLKRALTDPRILSGIGNAHSDEILLRARLSPAQRTHNLSDDELRRLFATAREELTEWATRLQEEAGGAFPGKVTAFHPAMGAHGKYQQPCPQCGTAIQRIAYAANETNYCPTCQTGGRLLADRALSRLLGDDWPRTLEELEELKRR